VGEVSAPLGGVNQQGETTWRSTAPSHGHASGADFWYDQPQHEWVIVLKGAARIEFEDGMIAMQPGDFINIAAFRKHRVDWTTPDEPTVWLGVRYGNQG